MANGDEQRAGAVVRIQMVAVGVLAAPVIWLGVGVCMARLRPGGLDGPAGTPDDVERIVGPILLALGIVSAAASLPLRKVLESRLLQDDSVQNRLRVVLIAMALAESAAIMGLVHALMTGQLGVLLVLCGCSLAIGILHFPTRPWIERPFDGTPR